MSFDTKDAEAKDAAFGARMLDATPAMQTAQDILVEAIEQNFDSESAAGEGWPALSPYTIEDRAKKGFPAGPILERTGRLRASATSIRESAPDGVQVGAPDEDAIANYHASLEPRSRIPFRDFLAIGEPTIEQIDEALIAHLESE